VEVTHEVLRIRSRSFTVAPITIAYRGHFRDVAPGDTYEFRLLTPQARHRDENRPPGVPRAGVAQGFEAT
jgi:alpha,alpha-trehalase